MTSLIRYHADGFESEKYGADGDYQLGVRAEYGKQHRLVAQLSRMDELYNSHVVANSRAPSLWKYAQDDRDVWTKLNLDQYLEDNPITGLLIAKDDEILVECYQYRRRPFHRFASFSMAKSVVGMLMGIAADEGHVQLDEPAERYVPKLKGTEYGMTPLRALLRMSSGVRFNEEYAAGESDIAKLGRATFARNSEGAEAAILPFNTREAPAGTRFSYSSAETQVLGLVLRRAIGRPVADYLSEKIWKPIGAEAEATWLIDKAGQETTFGFLNARLRDFALLGRMMAHDGRLNGHQIVPQAWVHEMTSAASHPQFMRPGNIAGNPRGYGYQTWLLPGPRRQFAFSGVRGQGIVVDPEAKLVMAHTAVWPDYADIAAQRRFELWNRVTSNLI